MEHRNPAWRTLGCGIAAGMLCSCARFSTRQTDIRTTLPQTQGAQTSQSTHIHYDELCGNRKLGRHGVSKPYVSPENHTMNSDGDFTTCATRDNF